TVDKRSLSSLLRLSAVLITVKGNSAPHQASRLERQALAISLRIKFLGHCLHTESRPKSRLFFIHVPFILGCYDIT
ncbi:hypothetical protein V7146_15100, partial [Gottfriedia acidiceleris]|uniref:hypothetical protein n=1 Tax=Gottfriedia acidiceleris TaxID=371036 RepID=UPI003000755F